jgi:large subunit ribosomal protein L5
MSDMKKITIDKVTLNIGAGEAGDKLTKAVKLLEKITGNKPIKTITMKRIPTWSLRPKLPIGAKVTLRKEKAITILRSLFAALENKVLERKFDRNGNISFGIKEYIDIPGVEYEPDIGIIGLDVAVTLKRPGYRIKERNQASKISSKHKIKKEEAIEFIKTEFKVEIVSKGEQDDI